MDKQWPFLYKVTKAELDIEFFLWHLLLEIWLEWWYETSMDWERGWEGENGKPLPGESGINNIFFVLFFFFETNFRYCQWEWRNNVLPSPSQCWGAGASCDRLHPAPQCSGPGWKLKLATGDRNNLASPWSGGHSTDFPWWTTAETRPTFNQQQYQTQEDKLFIAFL